MDWSYETSGLNGSSELVGAHLTFSISASLAGLRGNLLLFFPLGTYDSSLFVLICLFCGSLRYLSLQGMSYGV